MHHCSGFPAVKTTATRKHMTRATLGRLANAREYCTPRGGIRVRLSRAAHRGFPSPLRLATPPARLPPTWAVGRRTATLASSYTAPPPLPPATALPGPPVRVRVPDGEPVPQRLQRAALPPRVAGIAAVVRGVQHHPDPHRGGAPGGAAGTARSYIVYPLIPPPIGPRLGYILLSLLRLVPVSGISSYPSSDWSPSR
eukprot:6876613-Pyramimonas_sp.AAC.1